MLMVLQFVVVRIVIQFKVIQMILCVRLHWNYATHRCRAILNQIRWMRISVQQGKWCTFRLTDYQRISSGLKSLFGLDLMQEYVPTRPVARLVLAVNLNSSVFTTALIQNLPAISLCKMSWRETVLVLFCQPLVDRTVKLNVPPWIT